MQLVKCLPGLVYLESEMPVRHPRWRCPAGRRLYSLRLRSAGAAVLI